MIAVVVLIVFAAILIAFLYAGTNTYFNSKFNSSDLKPVPNPDSTVFDRPRSSLLSYYSSETVNHATLILTSFLAIFALIQVRKEIGRWFPGLLALALTLVSYLGIRFYLWSQFAESVVIANPVQSNNNMNSIQLATAHLVFSKSFFTKHLIYFGFFEIQTLEGIVAIFFIILAVIFFVDYMIYGRKHQCLD